ncbi:MAG: DUF3037 domain-containing protein [Sphingobacteriales bacterium]|nr:MAG: DUF3037 domain-containing protein [Sphingobacteriales bacterium]
MQDKHLFEYAVIRVVPRVEREEFLNVGVMLYTHRKKFLGIRYTVNRERLTAFNGLVECDLIQHCLESFERICHAGANSGPIGALDAASRFRWLTSPRSTIVQTSKVHPGFCSDPEAELERLFQQLVL